MRCCSILGSWVWYWWHQCLTLDLLHWLVATESSVVFIFLRASYTHCIPFHDSSAIGGEWWGRDGRMESRPAVGEWASARDGRQPGRGDGAVAGRDPVVLPPTDGTEHCVDAFFLCIQCHRVLLQFCASCIRIFAHFCQRQPDRPRIFNRCKWHGTI